MQVQSLRGLSVTPVRRDVVAHAVKYTELGVSVQIWQLDALGSMQWQPMLLHQSCLPHIADQNLAPMDSTKSQAWPSDILQDYPLQDLRFCVPGNMRPALAFT